MYTVDVINENSKTIYEKSLIIFALIAQIKFIAYESGSNRNKMWR